MTMVSTQRARSGSPLWRALRDHLPEGGALPADVWAKRHRTLLCLLWAHVPALLAFSLLPGQSLPHAGAELLPVVFLAAVATRPRTHRNVATVASSLGLLTCSAVLVHASSGVIEMHFHYFVMVGLVALYQDWSPYLTAIAYVFLQHGAAGALDASNVYNHPAAVADPWQWAAIHGAFILAMSAAGIASWRFNEQLLRNEMQRSQQLSEAQRVARLGSWQIDLATGEATWSAELYRLLGLEPGECEAGPDTILEMVHPDDLEGVRADLDAIFRGLPVARDSRMVLPDGTVRWVHAQGELIADDTRGRVYAGTMQDLTALREAEEQAAALSLLSSTLDSTADGILVVDGHGRITTFNQQFLELWRLPAGVLDDHRDEAVLFELAAPQLADPEAFRQRVADVYARSDSQSLDILEFADGRVFERYSQPQRIGTDVVGRVWSFRDITDRARLERELAHQAFHDSLTGLANRALFGDRISHALSRRPTSGSGVAVLYLDVDGFKSVNDRVGHTAGDELLVAIAGRISRVLRGSDTAARLGGDEFAVLVEDMADLGDVTAIAERLIESMAEPFVVGERQMAIHASVGIALDDGEVTAEQLLANADLAMYTAKRTQKGCVEVFRPDMRAALVSRQDLEADLRRALEREELAVHYQPIVDHLGRPHGLEALVRWQHPERGALPPAEFIPVAEESGLVCELGRQVLTSSCRQVLRWHRSHPDLSLSVNLSPVQLESDGLVAEVEEILSATGFPASKLVLEITEGALVSDCPAATERLASLRALGIRLAIDDFGTGYSSLSYLQHFPVDVLKIDRAFVQRADIDPQSSALVRSIVAMAASLGLEAVAEGVETQDQQAVLTSHGCALSQGYHHARPMDAGSMGRYLACAPRLVERQRTAAATSA